MLADVLSEDVDVVVVGGDVVWGPMPQETMDLLRSLDRSVEFLVGNADRDVFDRVGGRWKETNDWCADRLSEDHLDFLRSRPAEVVVEMDGLGAVLFCHGSPRSDEEAITTATPDERIVEMCAGRAERIVVCGHTHAQFERSIGDLRIVNAGSVGNPFGAAGAYWAIFGPDVELRLTTYDVQAAAAAIRSSGFPGAESMAAQVENPGPPAWRRSCSRSRHGRVDRLSGPFP